MTRISVLYHVDNDDVNISLQVIRESASVTGKEYNVLRIGEVSIFLDDKQVLELIHTIYEPTITE